MTGRGRRAITTTGHLVDLQRRRVVDVLSVPTADPVAAWLAAHPGFTTMRQLVLSFRTILRVGRVETLHRWLARAQATSVRPRQPSDPVGTNVQHHVSLVSREGLS